MREVLCNNFGFPVLTYDKSEQTKRVKYFFETTVNPNDYPQDVIRDIGYDLYKIINPDIEEDIPSRLFKSFVFGPDSEIFETRSFSPLYTSLKDGFTPDGLIIDLGIRINGPNASWDYDKNNGVGGFDRGDITPIDSILLMEEGYGPGLLDNKLSPKDRNNFPYWRSQMGEMGDNQSLQGIARGYWTNGIPIKLIGRIGKIVTPPMQQLLSSSLRAYLRRLASIISSWAYFGITETIIEDIAGGLHGRIGNNADSQHRFRLIDHDHPGLLLLLACHKKATTVINGRTGGTLTNEDLGIQNLPISAEMIPAMRMACDRWPVVEMVNAHPCINDMHIYVRNDMRNTIPQLDQHYKDGGDNWQVDMHRKWSMQINRSSTNDADVIVAQMNDVSTHGGNVVLDIDILHEPHTVTCQEGIQRQARLHHWFPRN